MTYLMALWFIWLSGAVLEIDEPTCQNTLVWQNCHFYSLYRFSLTLGLFFRSSWVRRYFVWFCSLSIRNNWSIYPTGMFFCHHGSCEGQLSRKCVDLTVVLSVKWLIIGCAVALSFTTLLLIFLTLSFMDVSRYVAKNEEGWHHHSSSVKLWLVDWFSNQWKEPQWARHQTCINSCTNVRCRWWFRGLKPG